MVNFQSISDSCFVSLITFFQSSIEPLRQNLEIVSLFLYYFVFYLTGDYSNN